MVQYDVLWNFMTGKYEEAAQRGVAYMGLSGPYTWVEARAEQLITHGVEPKENALACTQCHNGGAQMSLPGLGYTLKNTQQVVCTQCHEAGERDASTGKKCIASMSMMSARTAPGATISPARSVGWLPGNRHDT